LDPALSIGVTTYNEEETIGRVLKTLIEESPRSSEIIVVAGGEDRTVDIVKSYARGSSKIKLLEEETRRGKPAALNRILRSASGKIIALTDGDVLVKKGALRRIVEAFKDDEVGAACGKVVPTNDRGSMSGFWAHFLYDTADVQRTEACVNNTFFHLTGYLCAIRSGVIDTVPEGLLADDAVMGLLVREKGYLVGYVPDAVVEVTFPESVWDFLRQKRRTLAGFLQIEEQFGRRDRSLFQEGREGFINGLKYCRNPREVFYFLSLCLFRVFAWTLAYYDVKIRRKSLVEEWEFARTTKRGTAPSEQCDASLLQASLSLQREGVSQSSVEKLGIGEALRFEDMSAIDYAAGKGHLCS